MASGKSISRHLGDRFIAHRAKNHPALASGIIRFEIARQGCARPPGLCAPSSTISGLGRDVFQSSWPASLRRFPAGGTPNSSRAIAAVTAFILPDALRRAGFRIPAEATASSVSLQIVVNLEFPLPRCTRMPSSAALCIEDRRSLPGRCRANTAGYTVLQKSQPFRRRPPHVLCREDSGGLVDKRHHLLAHRLHHISRVQPYCPVLLQWTAVRDA